ncbi:divergent polysaccharide deacetylase family protein [Salinispirillum sp. LH 10-3-1]|uniref:Divergent polysaccharide deacetylase family protein n=1 Tax=Salinispirillum sp. LH 10-3-1 TaxID=2952525 RepID=A0AB38YHQ9_9GAMM
MWRQCLLILSLSLGLCLTTQAQQPLRMVIIIDDVGNNLSLGRAAVNLPGNVTLAVLPGLAYSKQLATMAHNRGREVMLHMPMANHARLPLGPMGLQAEMSTLELQQTLAQALEDVPHVQGINNHTGSLLTENAAAMSAVMDYLHAHRLYFIDSLTTPNSVAYQAAREQGVPALRRHVFLDHEQTHDFIMGQFGQALGILERHSEVIVIGHPYPETIEFLTWILPLLPEAGIEVVSPSQLLALRRADLAARGIPDGQGDKDGMER